MHPNMTSWRRFGAFATMCSDEREQTRVYRERDAGRDPILDIYLTPRTGLASAEVELGHAVLN